MLREGRSEWETRPFAPYGYEERQHCSPGFDLPVSLSLSDGALSLLDIAERAGIFFDLIRDTALPLEANGLPRPV